MCVISKASSVSGLVKSVLNVDIGSYATILDVRKDSLSEEQVVQLTRRGGEQHKVRSVGSGDL